ncbi:hypothetical protein COB55_04265 [Candidatus Wolfebacteria bacterium]|nr:MAG: hypothetical protein COB55_04265 [Candidatus Wolfebacteria bacterium]
MIVDKCIKVFAVDKSCRFALNIPDNEVGCSGSRCSSCGGKVVYCNHLCKHCKLPFVGPFGLPQLPEWNLLESSAREELAQQIFHSTNHGRMTYSNVDSVPLTQLEAKIVAGPTEDEVSGFEQTHGESPLEIARRLFSRY